MRYLLGLAVLLGTVAVQAQTEDLGRVALVQALKDAACGARLMCVAAHPDDEDGATLAYYRMKYGVKTFAVIATRGEGGQNEIGPELYNELAVIRTREMLAAAKVQGSEPHFLDLQEFGFSKSLEETFTKWGHDEALKRMLTILRELHPDVVITHHGLMKDHGNHQAIGQIILEAVDAAADPKYPFGPGIVVQALDVRKFEGGGEMNIPLGELEPMRGRTYAQVAARALEEHRSQGMKFFIDRYLSGSPVASYSVRSHVAAPTGSASNMDDLGPLFEDIKVSLRPASLRTLARDAEVGLSNVAVLDALAKISPEDRATAADDLAVAAAIAAELRVQANANDATTVRGQALEITAQINDYGAADVAALRVTLTGTRGGFESVLATQEISVSEGVAEAKFTLTVPDSAAFTMPHAERIFDGDVVFRPQLQVRIEGTLRNGLPFARSAAVYVDVAPPVTAAFSGGPYLLNPLRMQREAVMALTLTNHAPGAGRVAAQVQVPVGWHATPSIAEVDFTEAEEARTVSIKVITVESFEGRESVRVSLDGSPHTASTEVVSAAVALPKDAMVGLVRSYDDTLEKSMRRLGIAYALITADDFDAAALARFTTILVDMRSYQYRPDLVANTPAVFEYVRNGGNVVVMYQKTFDWRPAYAPLPFNVANNRVTLEDAEMTLLVPGHRFFNQPNRIAEADWQDWVQERGLYFAGDWAKDYTPLIACNDPGESPPPGALITTDYGKGTYSYCALALYRQLHTLNPGALRLFANLLDH